MNTSVIIPILNEEDNISRLVKYLLKYKDEHFTEILVVDGGDGTVAIVHQAGAIVLPSLRKRRAGQMNLSVHRAKEDILYFIYADALIIRTRKKVNFKIITREVKVLARKYDKKS